MNSLVKQTRREMMTPPPIFFKNEQRKELIKKIKNHYIASTPYMLTDLDIIRERTIQLRKVLPDLQLYYAVKAFSDSEVINTIKPYVQGFDVASVNEINLLLDHGVVPTNLTFSNPVKSADAISEAWHRGIKKFAIQSKEELKKLALHASGSDVFVRVKMDDNLSAVPLSSKFGCELGDVIPLLKYARQLKLNPLGLTFHVGSQQTKVASWINAIEKSQSLIRIARAKGLDASSVNIGGGFPVHYLADDPFFDDLVPALRDTMAQEPTIDYSAEPGRFLVAESSSIVTSVIGIEKRNGMRWLFLDVGLFQAFLGATRYGTFPYAPFSAKNRPSFKRMQSYTLTGPTCDSWDIIRTEVKLPDDIKIGDRLIFPNTGAYTVVYGSRFNGFDIPPRIFIN